MLFREGGRGDFWDQNGTGIALEHRKWSLYREVSECCNGGVWILDKCLQETDFGDHKLPAS